MNCSTFDARKLGMNTRTRVTLWQRTEPLCLCIYKRNLQPKAAQSSLLIPCELQVEFCFVSFEKRFTNSALQIFQSRHFIVGERGVSWVMLGYIQMRPLSARVDVNRISPTPGCDNWKCYQSVVAKYLFGGISLPSEEYFSKGQRDMLGWNRNGAKLSHSTKQINQS